MLQTTPVRAHYSPSLVLVSAVYAGPPPLQYYVPYLMLESLLQTPELVCSFHALLRRCGNLFLIGAVLDSGCAGWLCHVV